MIEGFTYESTVDVQVQELENLPGVIRSIDERSFVDWTHFVRLRVESWELLEDLFMTKVVRWGVVRREGLSKTMGLYTEVEIAGHLQSTQYF